MPVAAGTAASVSGTVVVDVVAAATRLNVCHALKRKNETHPLLSEVLIE